MNRPTTLDPDTFTDAILPAILEAGRLEMAHFASGVTIEKKSDNSPVTIADHEAEAVILAALASLAPKTPVIAEELAAAGGLPPASDTFFLVDALDGTRLFISGKPEFTINVALIEDRKPVFGLIYAPAFGRLYVTRSDGSACVADLQPDADVERQRALPWQVLATRAPDLSRLTSFNSRTSGGASGALLAALGVTDARPLGSSLKFCYLAAGEGDLYVRLGNTSEWDTAAGQAILEAAGGCVTGVDGQSLTYGHADRGYLNPHFVAWGRTPLFEHATR